MNEIKERPILFSSEMVRAILDDRKTETRRVTRFQPKRFEGLVIDILSKNCPYGKPGDILYVRECFFPHHVGVCYRADYDVFNMPKLRKWKPSIHMPKKFSRIKLKIKEIKVERIQEIKILDCRAEGFVFESSRNIDVIGNFMALWDSLNKKRGFGWDSNCFVWVIKFEKVK